MKIQLYLKSYHAEYINSYISIMQKYLTQYKYTEEKQIFQPLAIKKYTVLRSPHVDKKARDQFECTTHRRIIRINFKKGSISDIFFLERLLIFISSIAVGVDVRLEYVSKL